MADRESPEPTVPRCPHVEPLTPWGPSQCALPAGHEERGEGHAYDPLEGAEYGPDPGRGDHG